MKKNIITLVLLFVFGSGFSQPWTENLPTENSKGQLSFFDYQKAFNDYWLGKEINNGYYTENGIEKKAYGWKQYKRWENYWKLRVDKNTGEFPTSTQLKEANTIYQKNKNQNLRTKNGTGDWTSLGPSSSTGGYNGVGRINCIAFHPSDPNTFWVTTPGGGVWGTSNAGTTWSVLTDNNEILATTAIVVPSDYETSKTIYVGTGERDSWRHDNGMGVIKSTDGGNSWNSTGLTFDVADGISINKLLIHPNNNNILYAATSDGIYKTTTAGASWSLIYSENYICDLEFNPGDPTILYASNKYWGKIYKLTNDGASTSTVYYEYDDGARRIELAIAPSSSNVVFAVVVNTDSGLKKILKSVDNGSSYSAIYTPSSNPSSSSPNILCNKVSGNTTGGQGWFDLALIVDPNNSNTLYCGGVTTWKSTNGGSSWSLNNFWTSTQCSYCEIVHADKHYFAYNGSTLYECNDGGLYKTTDGSNWDDISNGIINSQMYKLGVSQTEKAATITGLQDNGSKLLQDDGIWDDVTGGDGMECIIDYTDYDIQYATYTYGTMYRTTNAWASKSTIDPSSAGQGSWVTPYIIDPVDHNTLYAGYADVWKTNNKGSTWTKISTMNSSSKLISLAIAPSNTQYLYTANDHSIWRTTNGGSLWTEISTGLPYSSSITNIAVKNDDPNTLWLTFGGYDSDVVYQSTDKGDHWTNISTGLPSIPANSIVQNHQNSSEVELYVGTDFGVYLKKGTDNWILFNTGLPKVVASDLEIYYDSDPQKSILRAATYGRGLWETPIIEIDTINPKVTTTIPGSITSSSVITGGNVTDQGMSSITERGVVWSLNSDPTTNDNKIIDASTGTGSFSTSITGLSGSSRYYVRAYAKNSDGTGYGAILTFTTLCGTITLPFSESFDGSSLSCWSTQTEGGATDKWKISATANAGGTPNEANVSFENISNATSRLISPPINTIGASELKLSFSHNFDVYGTGMEVKIQSSTDGTSWTDEAWSLTSDIEVGPETINTTISNNLNSTNTYIAFVIDGQLYYFYNWYLDNILVNKIIDCTPPTTQATNCTVSEINDNDITINWTSGGDHVIVLAREGSAVNTDPYNGDNYSANADFTNGEDIGSGNIVVYSGTDQTVTVTHLTDITEYYFAVYKYYDTVKCYNTTAPATTNATTVGYCYASGEGVLFLNGVVFGDISTSGSGDNGYENHTDLSTDLNQGETYTLSIINGHVYTDNDLGVWIDFNDNSSFDDDDENVICTQNDGADGDYDLLIPVDANPGSHRMRIRTKYFSIDCGDPCGTTTYGEVEDYSVNVINSAITTDISEVHSDAVKIYPNPTNGKIYIEGNNIEQVEVINIVGEIVSQSITDKNNILVDLSSLSKGIYFVKVITDTEIIIEKVVVE